MKDGNQLIKAIEAEGAKQRRFKAVVKVIKIMQQGKSDFIKGSG